MKIKSLIFLSNILLFFCVNSYGQSENQAGRLKFIGIEASLNNYSGETKNTDKIRANISYFDSNSNSLANSFYKSYAGIKGELRSKDNKFGLSMGLRYTHISSTTGDGASSSSNFFYFLINNKGTTTEYLRISEINQRSNYIGVPVEFRYFPFMNTVFRPYVKISIEFAYSIENKIDVSFYEETMDSRKNELGNMLQEANSYFYSLGPAIGFELGGENKPSVGIELSSPSVFLTNNVSSLITPTAGVGFQINLHIPLNKLQTKN